MENMIRLVTVTKEKVLDDDNGKIEIRNSLAQASKVFQAGDVVFDLRVASQYDFCYFGESMQLK